MLANPLLRTLPSLLGRRLASSSSASLQAESSAHYSSRSLLAVGALAASTLLYMTLNGNDAASADVATTTDSPPLAPSEWRSFRLASREQITHDTALYRFDLPGGSEQELNLPVASCLMVKSDVGEVARPYTPVSTEHEKGHFDLIVKTYAQGNVSRYFDRLVPGESDVQMKGPFKKIDVQPNLWQSITFVVGGTGITPAWQILQKLLNDPTDKTKIHLIYSNKREVDLILGNELNELQKQHPDRFTIHFVTTRPLLPVVPAEYINEELLRRELPPPSLANQKIFVCGPLPFYRSISGTKAPDFSQGDLSGILKDLGYTSEQVFKL